VRGSGPTIEYTTSVICMRISGLTGNELQGQEESHTSKCLWFYASAYVATGDLFTTRIFKNLKFMKLSKD